MTDSGTHLLEVRGLRAVFMTATGEIPAVDGIDFEIRTGESVGVVGESGCGKSATALSVMGLLPKPAGRIAAGSIRFAGRELRTLEPSEMRALRGNEIAMVFQEPMTSLNPVFTVGSQIAEAVRIHRHATRRDAWAHAVRMLELVEIPDPAERAHDYPHQLSGGMRQRVMIAMALSCDPRLLIADEPTTALDVTIQAQVLELIDSLRARLGMALVLITHDLGVVAERCDRILVMYAGRIVETGPVRQVLVDPCHPYTRGLLASQPEFAVEGRRLRAIPGNVPRPGAFPSGCRFRDRCELAEPRCAQSDPSLVTVRGEHEAACLVTTERRTSG
jgi:oligopeptide/dipeptide ABC transporter ATP-binding protein